MIDARIPMLAAQAGQVNLADLYQQTQDNKFREQSLQMRQRQLDLQEKQMLDSLDAEKRKAVAAGLKDMVGAVQWADTPEKWAQVQRAYAQQMPEVMQYGFENRESALLRLGQMSEYLDATAPKIMSVDAGGSVAAVDPRTGQPNFTVLPNPGDKPAGAPAGGGFQEGATATNPQTGEKIIYRNGQWQPAGGSGGNVGGGFPTGQ